MLSSDTRIAVVGATGAVGREALAILAARGHDSGQVVAIASDRSEGIELPFGSETIRARSLTDRAFEEVETAIFALSADLARRWVPIALEKGANAVDNSSAFRLDRNVPLVVPEINPEALEPGGRGPVLIANPNCSTILLLVALNPVRKAFGIERAVVATYQAVSGAGLAAMDELREQAATALAGRPVSPVVFREPCAFNVFSHDSEVDPFSGLNGEERKMIDESRKIWRDPGACILPTCVRVPVLRAHTQAVTFTTRCTATEDQLRLTFANAPGVRIVDDRAENAFPTPLKATGRDDVLVGRLRAADGSAGDVSTTDFSLLLSGDQLRKGAALNAIQIADLLAERARARTASLVRG